MALLPVSLLSTVLSSNTDWMFFQATAFQKNFGDAQWVQSSPKWREALKTYTTTSSSGSNWREKITTRATTSAGLRFAPRSRAQVKAAVGLCIGLSPVGDCANGPQGPIGEWDVSDITDMHGLFVLAKSFNQGLTLSSLVVVFLYIF